MDLRQCLDNLQHDVNNGGLEDDSFAMNCYITMANEAHRILSTTSAQQDKVEAQEYLEMCRNFGTASLKYVAGL